MIQEVKDFRRMMFEWYYEGIEFMCDMADVVPPRFLYYDQLRWASKYGDFSDISI